MSEPSSEFRALSGICISESLLFCVLMNWGCSASRCPSLLVVGDSSPAVDAVVGLNSYQSRTSAR